MMASETLFRLDAFGITAAGWIATWLLHGLVLCAAALLIGRVLRSGALREQLFKWALVGAFVTTAGQALGAGLGETFRLELGGPVDSGRAIAVAGAVSNLALVESRDPRPAPATVPEIASAVAPPSARWRWAHALPIVALLVALAGGARLLGERRRLARVLAGRRLVESAEWNADLLELAGRAGLARVPRLTASASLSSPIVLARGELVVPTRALAELGRGARRALLAHELAHLARRDPRWFAMAAFLCCVFALQPLQRLVRRRLLDEMELACDARAVHWTGDGLPLARCLATVASWVRLRPPPTLVASMTSRHSSLVRRVEHALAPATSPTSAARRRIFGLGVCSMLALFACGDPQVQPPQADPAGDEEMVVDALLVDAGATRTLDIEIDGRIRADGELLYDPAADSFVALDAHLAELVAGMETQPLDPESPDGALLAMDELVLHAVPGAPARSLLKAMEHCAIAGIWRLRLTGEWPGGDEGIAVPLPVDLDSEIPAAVEEGESDARAERAVAVTLRVQWEGRKLDAVTGAPWDGEGRFVYDDRRIEYSVGWLKTFHLAELRSRLEALEEQWAGARVLIDARQGIVYQDVVDVLDIVMSVGLTEITFVGSYE